MSNHKAVATVTEALRQFLSRELHETGLGLTVNAQKPPTEPFAGPTVTIFCYQVTPNVALRNRDAPIRDSDGTLLNRPRAVLDLSYLISFYGSESELEPQRLLGSTVRALYESPVLSRADIETAAAQPFLTGSDLAAAVDRVRFTPTHLDIDDSYKLWTMMSQTPYALSLTYLASVVAIDGTAVPVAGKPVLTRTVSAVQGGRPAVDRILAQPPSGGPPVEGPVPSGDAVVVEGSGLAASGVWVQLGDAVVAADEVHDDRVLVRPPQSLPAGVYPLRVRHDVRTADRTMVRVLESNEVAYVRQPRIASTDVDALGHLLVVHLDVPVRDEARVRLLLDELGAPAGRPAHGYVLDAPFPLGQRPDPNSVRVSVDQVVPGRYLARVEVDGAQSPLEQGQDGTFTGPVVTL